LPLPSSSTLSKLALCDGNGPHPTTIKKPSNNLQKPPTNSNKPPSNSINSQLPSNNLQQPFSTSNNHSTTIQLPPTIFNYLQQPSTTILAKQKVSAGEEQEEEQEEQVGWAGVIILMDALSPEFEEGCN
jgi:hypothetical protein